MTYCWRRHQIKCLVCLCSFFVFLPDPSQAHKWICMHLIERRGQYSLLKQGSWHEHYWVLISALEMKILQSRTVYIIISPQALSIMHCAVEKFILWHISQITSHFPLFYLSMWFSFGSLRAGGGTHFLKDSYGSERLMIFWSSNAIFFSGPMLLIWPLIFWNMLG